MENLVVNYTLLNEKVNKNIVLISDLHDYPGKRKTNLPQNISLLNPDMILVAGDILSGNKYSFGNKSFEYLKRFLSEISEISPVVLSLGNHDLFGCSSEFESSYKSLEKVGSGMVFPLFNDSVILGDTRITEFHPRHSAFAPSSQDSGHALVEFLEDAKNGLMIPKENDSLYNILLSHNPKVIRQALSIAYQSELKLTDSQRIELELLAHFLKRFDMVGSGHLHNGYVKSNMILNNPSKYLDYGYWEMTKEKNIEGNTTFFRPWIYKKTDMCRGTIFIGDGKERIIQLLDGLFYKVIDDSSEEIDSEKAWALIQGKNMTPIVVSGGINKFFNIPVDKSEITQVKVLRK